MAEDGFRPPLHLTFALFIPILSLHKMRDAPGELFMGKRSLPPGCFSERFIRRAGERSLLLHLHNLKSFLCLLITD